MNISYNKKQHLISLDINSNSVTPRDNYTGNDKRMYHSLNENGLIFGRNKDNELHTNSLFDIRRPMSARTKLKHRKSSGWFKSQSTPPIVASHKDINFMTTLTGMDQIAINESIELSPDTTVELVDDDGDEITGDGLNDIDFIQTSIYVCRKEFIRAVFFIIPVYLSGIGVAVVQNVTQPKSMFYSCMLGV